TGAWVHSGQGEGFRFPLAVGKCERKLPFPLSWTALWGRGSPVPAQLGVGDVPPFPASWAVGGGGVPLSLAEDGWRAGCARCRADSLPLAELPRYSAGRGERPEAARSHAPVPAARRGKAGPLLPQMEAIEELALAPCASSQYLRPYRLRYRQNGTKKFWDFMRTHDRSGVGVTGSKQTLFYAEVTDQMKTGEGGGQPEEGELIEVVEVPLQDSMKFAFDEHFPKTMGIIFSFMWFQSNVALKLLEK
uniref:Nudix hydrolase 14 n=1 Tax=Gopherus evgoodei TaxID=1825980 RepID=A0A8C4VLW6_9SAUR